MSAKLRFSSALFRARTEHRLTQERVAEMLGISVRWLQKLERGTSEPNLDLICKIQKHFNLNLAGCVEEEEA